MYQCPDCKKKFEHPAHRRSADNPDLLQSLCPICGHEKPMQLPVRYCHGCGIRLTEAQTEYCSALCRKRATRLFAEQLERAKRRNEHPLTALTLEIEAYNADHGTRYSYGQYVALVRPKLKGGPA